MIQIETVTEGTIKAIFLKAKDEIPVSRKLEQETNWGLGELAIPYDPAICLKIVEQSSVLPQCITAMVQNIDGYGYILQAADDAPEKEAEAEYERLKEFFDTCNPECDFTEIRKRLRYDIEATGNGYLEIIRNSKGEIVGIENLPATEMRLLPRDDKPIEVEMLVRRGNELVPVRYMRYFRRYVQRRAGQIRYFKQFGDPRTVDAETGEYRENPKLSATEVVHFRIYTSRTPYGVPRWIGVLAPVLGLRASEEVNLTYFDNKAVPPLAIIVNGELSSESTEQIRQAVSALKGRHTFHGVLLLQAPGASENAIRIEKLTEAQQRDALFQNYEEKCKEKIRSAFRLPPIYIGDLKDYNRSTAETAKIVAEEQVFAPERKAFDDWVNRMLMPQLGAKYHTFISLGPTVNTSAESADILAKVARLGLTTREVRDLMQQVFNREFEDPENADWLDMPLEVYLEKLKLGLLPQGNETAQTVTEEFVEKLLEIRKALKEHANRDGSNSNY